MSILSVVILLVNVTIEIDRSDYKQLGPLMPKVIERGVDLTAHYMIGQLQVKSPIDTGYLKGWFRYQETDSMVDIRSPAKYAIFQDQGTYSYGPAHRQPKTKAVGGIRPKKFVEKSINATAGRLDSLWIKAIQDVIK